MRNRESESIRAGVTEKTPIVQIKHEGSYALALREGPRSNQICGASRGAGLEPTRQHGRDKMDNIKAAMTKLVVSAKDCKLIRWRTAAGVQHRGRQIRKKHQRPASGGVGGGRGDAHGKKGILR